ncbi:hypothetical protein K438DRAFT_226440 [Mycena galopus ATCC 62051]|nr:hypothetical protein K438DRAFT_226440 [Mycena galopus ATCC 62051]
MRHRILLLSTSSHFLSLLFSFHFRAVSRMTVFFSACWSGSFISLLVSHGQYVFLSASLVHFPNKPAPLSLFSPFSIPSAVRGCCVRGCGACGFARQVYLIAVVVALASRPQMGDDAVWTVRGRVLLLRASWS